VQTGFCIFSDIFSDATMYAKSTGAKLSALLQLPIFVLENQGILSKKYKN